MAFKHLFFYLAVSSAIMSLPSLSGAVEIHSIDDFKPYVKDVGYYLVEIDKQLSESTYEVDLNGGAIDKGLHLIAAFDDSGLQTTLENNHLIWHSGDIGSQTNPTDAFLYTAYSESGNLKNNSLSIESGLFAPKVVGSVTYGRLVAARTDKGNLTGNTVSITGGTFFANIEVLAAYSSTASGTAQTTAPNKWQKIIMSPSMAPMAICRLSLTETKHLKTRADTQPAFTEPKWNWPMSRATLSPSAA